MLLVDVLVGKKGRKKKMVSPGIVPAKICSSQIAEKTREKIFGQKTLFG